MALKEPPFTVGIEEEYLLVDKQTRDLANDPPPDLMHECEEQLSSQVAPEFLRAQIEIGTRVCASIDEARSDLNRLRRTIVNVADKHGLAPIAASTHPFALWHEQKYTDKDRYRDLNRDMQASARRLLICGMHVHMGIDSDDMRVDLLDQLAYFLPHLLALSCSSPFWRGQNTGLQSYRLTVFDGLPRTRLPSYFTSYAEYQRHVQILIDAGIIQDASKIWWDLRPSSRYPTLEMRITDVCTRADDTITVAALTLCLARMLWRLRSRNLRWRGYKKMLIQENRWRAMRYGCDEGLIDFGKAAVIPYDELLEELLDMTREDAEYFQCVDAVNGARDIVRRGNSAKQQVVVYERAIAEGKNTETALADVVDHLIAETRYGL
ncbi:MAG: carboxylate-amine ligase [Gammaproteobacteria bacterium]|nr:carboxylate-amine ligase [Gammaproteobacteria bacterium]NNM21482.1 carboxylate-amine ligase [Gammaproteobacteria bacterium]